MLASVGATLGAEDLFSLGPPRAVMRTCSRAMACGGSVFSVIVVSTELSPMLAPSSVSKMEMTLARAF